MDKTKFVVQIDTKEYDKKPTGIEIGAIKKRVQGSKPAELTAEEILERITSGYALSPGILQNGLKAENWICQQLFCVDIDNDNENEPILYPKDAIRKLKTIDLSPIIYYVSYSSTKEKPKFRLIFAFDEPIVEESKRKIVAEVLVAIFPQADKSCINADRIFFGTNKEGKFGENVINFEKILELYQPQQVEIKLPSELEKLKNKFDFETYIRKNGGEILRENEHSITFKNCPICGHHECFVYFKDTKTFYCFGKNGSKGGSIIDFLMFTEKLSKNDAINFFKYELLKLPKEIKDEHQPTMMVSAYDLMLKDIPDPYFCVENLISQGLTLLAAPPKGYKSWLILHLGSCIANGMDFLGFKTNKSSVLYFALEDSKSRVKKRLRFISNTELPKNYYIINNAVNIEGGFVDDLEYYLKQDPDIKVFIIDTLQVVRGMYKSQNAYAKDYDDMRALKTFADKYNLCVIVVHHLKKENKKDDLIFNRISGTNGIFGAVDTALILDLTDKTFKEFTLHVTGRDVEQEDLTIQFNEGQWLCLGNAEIQEQKRAKKVYEENPIVIALKKLLKHTNKKWEGTIAELITALSKYEAVVQEKKPSAVAREINKLEEQLKKYDDIYHTPPPPCGSNGKRIHKFEMSSFGRSEDISEVLDLDTLFKTDNTDNADITDTADTDEC